MGWMLWLLLQALWMIVVLMPRAFVPVLAHALSFVVTRVAKKERRNLRNNIAKILNLPPHTTFGAMFERQVIYHQIVTFLETWRIVARPSSLISLRGWEDLDATTSRALAAGEGLVVITAHVGSWELAGHYTAKACRIPFHVLAKPSRSAAVTRVLDRLRQRMGTKVLWTNRKSLLRDMMEALARQEAVGFVMDQKPTGRAGPSFDFLGHPAEFVTGPAALAVRTGCPITATFCLREGPWRYRLLSETLLAPNHGLGEGDVEAVTEELVRAMERVVNLYPEQWTWNYRRWRFSAQRS